MRTAEIVDSWKIGKRCLVQVVIVSEVTGIIVVLGEDRVVIHVDVLAEDVISPVVLGEVKMTRVIFEAEREVNSTRTAPSTG